MGEGPLFLQDLEALEGEPNPPDMLFIDSAGANTARNNADLMVHRCRYPALGLPLAAMALYTFQAFAPSGGAGNRTSMRDGGPRAPRDLSGAFFHPVDRRLRELRVNDLQRGAFKALEQTADQIDTCYHGGQAEAICP